MKKINKHQLKGLFLTLLFTTSLFASQAALQDTTAHLSEQIVVDSLYRPIDTRSESIPPFDGSFIYLPSFQSEKNFIAYPFNIHLPIRGIHNTDSLESLYLKKRPYQLPLILVMGERAVGTPMYSFIESFNPTATMGLDNINFLLVEESGNPAAPYTLCNINKILTYMAGQNSIITAASVAQNLAAGDPATLHMFHSLINPQPVNPLHGHIQNLSTENNILKHTVDILDGRRIGQEIRHNKVLTKKDSQINALTQLIKASLQSQCDSFAQPLLKTLKTASQKLHEYEQRIAGIEKNTERTQQHYKAQRAEQKARKTRLKELFESSAQPFFNTLKTATQNMETHTSRCDELSKKIQAIKTIGEEKTRITQLKKQAEKDAEEARLRKIQKKEAKLLKKQKEKETYEQAEKNEQEILKKAQELNKLEIIQQRETAFGLIHTPLNNHKVTHPQRIDAFLKLLFAQVPDEITEEKRDKVIDLLTEHYGSTIATKNNAVIEQYFTVIFGFIYATEIKKGREIVFENIFIIKIFEKLALQHSVNFNDKIIQTIKKTFIPTILDVLDKQWKTNIPYSAQITHSLTTLMIDTFKMHMPSPEDREEKQHVLHLLQILRKLHEEDQVDQENKDKLKNSIIRIKTEAKNAVFKPINPYTYDEEQFLEPSTQLQQEQPKKEKSEDFYKILLRQAITSPRTTFEYLEKEETPAHIKTALYLVTSENFDNYLEQYNKTAEQQTTIKNLIKIFPSADSADKDKKMELLRKYKEKTKNPVSAGYAAAEQRADQAFSELKCMSSYQLEKDITKILDKKDALTLSDIQEIMGKLPELQKKGSAKKFRQTCQAIIKRYDQFQKVSDIVCLMSFAKICPDDIYKSIRRTTLV
ncbi:hypothetical protein K9K77_02605 [Candidatus Babeliales bacterium]|nr:hypothetical protein [Candidatus Babeliales bacterium]